MLLAAPLLVLGWWHAGRPWKPVAAIGLALGGGRRRHPAPQPAPLRQPAQDPLLAGGRARPLPGREVPPRGQLGLFFDAAFGLFACAPLWLLLIPAFGAARSRGGIRCSSTSCSSCCPTSPRGAARRVVRRLVAALPLRAGRRCRSWGSRWCRSSPRRRRPGARALLAGLGAATLALTLLWVAVPGWTYNFADGRTYLLDHLSERWGATSRACSPARCGPRIATWVWPAVGPGPGAARLVAARAAAIHRGRLHRCSGGTPRLWGLAAAIAFGGACCRWRRRAADAHDRDRGPTGREERRPPLPDRWVIERTRYRGGWVLREGESLTAPVVAGRRARRGWRSRPTSSATIRGRSTLELRAGDQLLATLRLARARQWAAAEVGGSPGRPAPRSPSRPCPADGASPGQQNPRTADPGQLGVQPNGAVLDRVEIAWR